MGIRRYSYWLLALAICLIGIVSADQVEPAKNETPAPPPSFRPGADVTLALTVSAPVGWHLNPMVPLRVQFDEEYLKTAPIKIKQAVWDFELAEYLPEFTGRIPFKLSDQVKDGALQIPLTVQCSICTTEGDQCTFRYEDLRVPLIVKSVAAPGERNQALPKGDLPYTHLLSEP